MHAFSITESYCDLQCSQAVRFTFAFDQYSFGFFNSLRRNAAGLSFLSFETHNFVIAHGVITGLHKNCPFYSALSCQKDSFAFLSPRQVYGYKELLVGVTVPFPAALTVDGHTVCQETGDVAAAIRTPICQYSHST